MTIYGAVLFGTASSLNSTISLSGSTGTNNSTNTTNTTLIEEEVIDETTEPVIDELPSTEEEELVLVCDSSLITLEFVNKLSYETLFTIPVIAESSPEYSASQ